MFWYSSFHWILVFTCSSFSKLLLHLKYNCAKDYPNTEKIIWLSCKENWLESIFYSLWLFHLKLLRLFVKTGMVFQVRSFFDVRVFNPTVWRYDRQSLTKYSEMNEKEKRKVYNERILNCDKEGLHACIL